MDDSNKLREAVPQSCAECRKRKAKCDRTQPCLQCTKTGHECLYERIYRTPLTRKHLTEVEEELARTKEILARYQAVHDGSEPISFASTNSRKRRAPETGTHHYASPSLHEALTLPARRNQAEVEAAADSSSLSTSDLDPSCERSIPTTNHESRTMNTLGTSFPSAPSSAHCYDNKKLDQSRLGPSTHSPAFTIETPPKDDFDWDERERSRTSGRFVDGMATLTGNSKRGYMGVASGAALLRLAEDGNNPELLDEEQHEETVSGGIDPASKSFSLSQLDPHVDAYFSTYHTAYPIVHESSFRAQFMELIPRPRGGAWDVLLYIVAAIGAFCSAGRASEIDLTLFDVAKAHLSIDMLETGNLTLVQALALMSNYVQKRNKPNSGYNYLGIAKRMALGIGLHKEFPAWHERPLMLEIRRRVWYCLYIFDVGAIITFSRPFDLPTRGIEVHLPMNVSDADITASTKSWPSESVHTTLYTHVRCQATFHLATSGIYERLISSFPSAQEMLELDDTRLGAWLRDMPAHFRQGAIQEQRHRLPHAIMQWRWRNLRILMYRPYLVRHFMAKILGSGHESSAAELTAIARCQEAVNESIEMITGYWQRDKQNVLACWYSLYFLMQALLIPVLSIRNDPFHDDSQLYRQQIQTSLAVISSMTHLNSAAIRCHATISNLCGPFLGDTTVPSVDESPQTQLNALDGFIWPIVDHQFQAPYEGFHESAAYDFMTQI